MLLVKVVAKTVLSKCSQPAAAGGQVGRSALLLRMPYTKARLRMWCLGGRGGEGHMTKRAAGLLFEV